MFYSTVGRLCVQLDDVINFKFFHVTRSGRELYKVHVRTLYAKNVSSRRDASSRDTLF